MMTLTQLMKYTFPNFADNAKGVYISKVRVGVNRAGQPKIIATAKTRSQSGSSHVSGQQHLCSVIALDKRKGFAGNVKVSCDCESFTYYCEWALHRQGAADIFYSTGEAADSRNPRGIPSLCKHLYALAKEIRTGGY